MPDWPDDDLDLDGPRVLPAELRQRLADALTAEAVAAGGTEPGGALEGEAEAAEALALGGALTSRLERALHDPLATTLAGLDGPRAVPPETQKY